MRAFKWGVLGVALVFAASCAKQPEIPFDRTSAQATTIAIFAPLFPKKANIRLEASVGKSMGYAGAIGALVGGLVDESIRSNHVDKFEEIAKAQNYSAHEDFSTSLTKSLQARGYTVSVVPAEREKKDYLEHYPKRTDENPIDAYLDVVVTDYGYLSTGMGSPPYRPFIWLKCKLVSAKDGRVLMQDVIQYDPLGPQDKTVTISPDENYAFVKFDDIVANGAKAIEGLKKAVATTTDTLGTLLH